MAEKKLNITIEPDNVAWVEFCAALYGMSMNAYINAAIRGDRDDAPKDVAAAYEAFVTARKE